MNNDAKILIVGHDIIEKSLYGYFKKQGFKNIYSLSQDKVDVLDQTAVRRFFAAHRPEYVFLSSVRSGGIEANQKFAAEFIYSNLECQNNIIHASHQFGAKKLLYFSGSCAYPKKSPQPIKEEYLLNGPLEETSRPYSIAKIAGIQMCQSYRKQYGFNAIAAVPATVYGPESDTHIETAHVIGALIGKFCEAKSRNLKEVVVWGTGRPRREFLFVDDFIEASLFLMERYAEAALINIGCGYDITIKELAFLIKAASDFKGKIVFDKTKPDGTMAKLMDHTKIRKLGWKPRVNLAQGIKRTYEWYEKKRGKK